MNSKPRAKDVLSLRCLVISDLVHQLMSYAPIELQPGLRLARNEMAEIALDLNAGRV
jgi:hypothetical protein